MDIKRLLAISDTHGNVPALAVVLKWVQNNYTVDGAVFLGDGIRDLQRAAAAMPAATGFSCEWTMVRGNNDYEHTIPEAACLDFAGRRFFLCHGHRYALYNNYNTLATAARNRGADTVLFGHTHVPCCETEDGILFINPGSISRPRSKAGSTFAIIECPVGHCSPDQPPKVQFWEIDAGGTIHEVKIT